MNGDFLSDEDFGAPADRSFGFVDTKYQWNRGHWITGMGKQSLTAPRARGMPIQKTFLRIERSNVSMIRQDQQVPSF